MKPEEMIRSLLNTRKSEYYAMLNTGIHSDVNERNIKDLLWILDDPEFKDW